MYKILWYKYPGSFSIGSVEALVLRVLYKAEKPLTHKQILSKVNKLDVSKERKSLYNILKGLNNRGLVEYIGCKNTKLQCYTLYNDGIIAGKIWEDMYINLKGRKIKSLLKSYSSPGLQAKGEAERFVKEYSKENNIPLSKLKVMASKSFGKNRVQVYVLK